eukprot:381738_1
MTHHGCDILHIVLVALSIIQSSSIFNNVSEIVYYVSSNGHDELDCGSETNACGTINYATNASMSASWKNISPVKIIIRGQNTESIINTHALYGYHPCIAEIYVTMDKTAKLLHNSLTYMFDPMYIQSKQDWFPDACLDLNISRNHSFDSFFNVIGSYSLYFLDYGEFTVVINNLVINSWVIPNSNTQVTQPHFLAIFNHFPQRLELNYIFNNLTFADNQISMTWNDQENSTLINAFNVEIHDSTFNNNYLGNSTLLGTALFGDTITTRYVIKSNLIDNLTLENARFIDCMSNSVELVVDVTNSIFNHIHLYDSCVINIHGATYNSVTVTNNSFKNVDGMIIFGEYISGIFIIDGISIITSRMTNLTDPQYHNPFLIELFNCDVNISNINISYLIADQLANHCIVRQYISNQLDGCKYTNAFISPDDLDNEWEYHLFTIPFLFSAAGIVYECDSPIAFIVVQSNKQNMANMHQILVTNDITSSSLKLAKQKLFHQNTWECVLNENVPAMIRFVLPSKIYKNQDLFEAGTGFITIDGQRLHVEGIKIEGSGSINVLLLQQGLLGKEQCELDGININYQKYCDYNCSFDPYALNTNMFGYNSGAGNFTLKNSQLHGSVYTSLDFQNGNAYIINSSIQYSLIAIHARESVEDLYIGGSMFVNIGKQYIYSLLQYQGYQMSMHLSSISLGSVPLIISAKRAWIEKSYFNINENTGIILLAPSWPSDFSNLDLKTTVMFFNNTLNRNTDTVPNELSFQYHGTVNAIGNVKMYVVNNQLFDLSKNVIKPLFFASECSICFSGNVIQASVALNVDRSFISACFKNSLFTENVYQRKNKCFYGSLGDQTNYMYHPLGMDLNSIEFGSIGLWTAINHTVSLIQAPFAVSIMLDNITFNTDFDGYVEQYPILQIGQPFLSTTTVPTLNTSTFVSVALTNVILLNESINIEYVSDSCNVICYDIFEQHNYYQYISQLHIKCDIEKYQDNAQQQYVSTSIASVIHHSTPYFIHFVYDFYYMVNSYLKIRFYITDRFGNRIDKYSSSINIFLRNDEISEHFYVNISEEIELKTTVTNDDAYYNYSIGAIVNDGELEVTKPITVSILPNQDIQMLPIVDWYLVIFISTGTVCMIVAVIILYCRHEYKNAFVVNKSLVLIIGISQFNRKDLLLDGVKKNVAQLWNLWNNDYLYDVFVCNRNTLYCSKQDIIDFIDEHKTKLDTSTVKYNAILIHIISHGDKDDLILTSDLKWMNTAAFIEHEITSILEDSGNNATIKISFQHACRGAANYHDGLPAKHGDADGKIDIVRNEQISKPKQLKQRGGMNMIELQNLKKAQINEQSAASNWVIIYATINGRTISDCGDFTQCICDAFGKNVNSIKKKNLRELITEIGRNLEAKTNNAEICTSKGLARLRYPQIRFEKNEMKMKCHHNNQYYSLDDDNFE